MLPADYHMHTPLCHHAVGEPTDYAARALEVGLTEIGFSEHAPMIRDDWDNWRMSMNNVAQYIAKVEQARRDHPALTIKIGLEVDYLPGHEDWIRKLADLHEWDYFIGSVHYVSDTFAIDDPSKIDEWKSSGPFPIWQEYFRRLTLAAGSGLFQIMGHPDLCKKWGFYPEEDCTPLYRTRSRGRPRPRWRSASRAARRLKVAAVMVGRAPCWALTPW
jgi:histidinol-phosphatase (PHP family)